MARLRTVLFAAMAGIAGPASTCEDGAVATLQAIAADIEALGAQYPQLAAFTAATHFDREARRIAYDWHTHRATHAGGWTAGVPNPDADGVWFFLDVHAPDSTAQIHTQPMAPAWCLGEQRVAFLILEGERTQPIAGRLQDILRKHGLVACER